MGRHCRVSRHFKLKCSFYTQEEKTSYTIVLRKQTLAGAGCKNDVRKGPTWYSTDCAHPCSSDETPSDHSELFEEEEIEHSIIPVILQINSNPTLSTTNTLSPQSNALPGHKTPTEQRKSVGLGNDPTHVHKHSYEKCTMFYGGGFQKGNAPRGAITEEN